MDSFRLIVCEFLTGYVRWRVCGLNAMVNPVVRPQRTRGGETARDDGKPIVQNKMIDMCHYVQESGLRRQMLFE